MDANKNVIPILSEDMGEGFKDVIDEEDDRISRKLMEQFARNKNAPKKDIHEVFRPIPNVRKR